MIHLKVHTMKLWEDIKEWDFSAPFSCLAGEFFAKMYWKNFKRDYICHIHQAAGAIAVGATAQVHTAGEAAEDLQRRFIAAILISIPFWTLVVDTPQKLEIDYDTNILIADILDVMTETEEAELSAKVKEFQDVTGVTPAVLTVANDEWKPYYESLENYAYDYYVNAFSDEKHWLIVYSTDSGTKFED